MQLMASSSLNENDQKTLKEHKKEKGKRKEKIIIVTYGTRDNSDTKFSHLEPCQCIPWSISECSPISTNYVRMSFLKILMLCNSDAPKKFHFTSLNVAN